MTDATVDEFMARRPLEWVGNPKVPRADLVVPEIKEAETTEGTAEDGKMSKSQMKKLLKQQQAAEKKAEKQAAKAAQAQ